MNPPNIINQEVVIDVETTGLHFKKDEIFGVAFCFLEDPHNTAAYWDIRDHPGIMQWLKDQLHLVKLYANHNAAFDVLFMMESGCKPPPVIKCTQVRASLIYEHHRSYTLADCAVRAGVTAKADDDIYKDLADLFGGQPTRKQQAPNMYRAPVDLMEDYGKGDVISAAELFHYQEAKALMNNLNPIMDFEADVTSAIVEMQSHGIRIDEDLAHQTVEELDIQIDQERDYLDHKAGFKVNPNPSGSIHKLFEPTENEFGEWFSSCGTRLDVTGAGKPSLNADALQRMKNPLAGKVLHVRQLMKLRDTFVKGHVISSAINGRVYPRINQSPNEFGGTYTGRFSVTQPAMQQIPVRNKQIGRIIQRLFLPDEGQDMSVADFGQIDLRVCGHYTANETLYEEYKADPNLDMHTFVSDTVGRERQFCKSISLGVPFGRGYGAIAEQLGLECYPTTFTTRQGEVVSYLKAGEEATELLDKYVARVPGTIGMLKKAKEKALRDGFLTTLCGRRLHFNAHTARKAAGVLYQSGAADLNKRTVVRLHKFMKEIGGSLLINIHDSYFVSIPKDAHHHLHEAKRLAEDHIDVCRIPIRLDFQEPSTDWAAAYISPDYTDGEYSGDIDLLGDKWG